MNKENVALNKSENILPRTEILGFKKEASVEMEEDVEILAQSKISDINSKVKILESNGKESLEKANNSINLPPEKFEDVKKNSGIKEKLNIIAEKAKQLAEEAKKKLKMATVIGMATMAMSGAEKT